MKHNKKRNTAFLYECLIKELTKAEMREIEDIINKKPSQKNTLYLAIPSNAKGVSVSGDWNPLGMRGTVSRTLIFDEVFVSKEEMLMPKGMYFEAAKRWPHMFYKR